jgi:hypothetical protein
MENRSRKPCVLCASSVAAQTKLDAILLWSKFEIEETEVFVFR